MKISKQNRREAKNLLQHCKTDGILDPNRVRHAVDDVITRKPRGFLATLSHFHRLVKLDEASRTAKIESAAPLDSAFQEKVKSHLARIYGPGLNISFAQNPSLLGGLRIQVGSDVYDGSVQARLIALKESF